MTDILFASDLDNTLLYSRRHRRAGDLCVEHLAGAEQGFMTPPAVELLRRVRAAMRFIPVTTRSVEQYRRIAWPAGTEPAYAVTTNGAVLLYRGAEDAAWRAEVAPVVAAAQEELMRLHALHAENPAFLRCRIVDGAYLFVYCADHVDAEACAAAYRAETHLAVLCSGRKIYFFPQGLDKGAALCALRQRFAPARVYAAGDSIIDLPLLAAADRAFAPRDLPFADSPHIRRHTGAEPFSEWLLGRLMDEFVGTSPA